MQSQFIIRGVVATFIVLTLFCATAVVANDVGSPEETLAANEAQRPVPPRPEANERPDRSSQRPEEEPLIVTVASGDSLRGIADSHGITLQHLFDANPQVQNPNLVEVGLQLRIPRLEEEFEHRPFPPPSAPEPPAAQQPFVPAPPPAQPPPATEPEFDGGVWDRLAECEASGNWQANTGNGYYGGLQFHPGTWEGFGGHQYAQNAHEASKQEQIEIAKRTQASQGWGAWPACSRKLGLR